MNKNGDYKKRLFKEYDQLQVRYADLCLFLTGDTELKAKDFTLMYEQKEIMENYIRILKRRMENLEDFKRYGKIVWYYKGKNKN